MADLRFAPSLAAKEASDYFNSLPYEEREKLAPLLDHYRQMGLAEAFDRMQAAARNVGDRIIGIRNG
jgi:hypothetical protein